IANPMNGSMVILRSLTISLGVLAWITLSSPTLLTDVYICKGPQSKRYHLDQNCRGLRNCSTRVYKVSLEEAQRMKRTLCGFED
ncbi:MAG: hypothetical protein LPK80_11535, partial [Bacteroidota bacterium]|nr:hypothetical protein [Bacteroidota bacterium]